MLRFLKGFFGKPIPPKPVEAPYKIETPVVAEPVKVEATAPAVVVDGHGDVHEVAPVPKAKKAPAKKTPAKKPAVIKAQPKPKAPRKPRAK